MRQWKTVERKRILSDGKFLTVERHAIELPDGRVIRDWTWLSMPEYVNILAFTEERNFICFRQTKYAIEGVSLAPAGGYLEPGEDPLSAAKRELLEETGYEAQDWVRLGQYAVDGNRGAGIAHLYLARGARRITGIKSDDLEEQELLILKQEQLEAALGAGEFKVLAWAAVVSLGLLYLDGKLATNA